MKKSILATLAVVIGLGIAASTASAGGGVQIHQPGAPTIEEILDGFRSNN